jgi:hypothetical protein
MAVGDKYLGKDELFVRQEALDTLDVAPRIDHYSLAGLFTPENGAVLLEGGNRYDGVAHD